MIEKHQGTVELRNSFTLAYEWLRSKGLVELKTAKGSLFAAQAEITTKGVHAGYPVIKFFQNRKDYARSYECCWGHYYNCNRTRIGMYCSALDSSIESIIGSSHA